MVEIRTEIDLLDSWFRIADRDGDGFVGGSEAVDFFQRSGLAKEPLFQVWNAVASGKPYLAKQQFYTAMRLVSAAQRSGGTLSQAEARSILVGLGPSLPPPTMAGLQQSKFAVPSVISQAQASPLSSVPTEQKSQGAMLPMSGDDIQRYQGLFAQLDLDRDGYVQGKDCFGAFMQWGLPKETLRDIWNLVAGSKGQLDGKEFISCLYLMDSVKKGNRLPKALPSENFPPLAAELGGNVTLADILAGHAASDVFSRQIAVPPPPERVRYTAKPSPQAQAAARLPAADDKILNSLEYLDRQRLMKERDEAEDLDRSHAKVEAELSTAKQQQAFFQQHLQQLTIFKSKTSAALLQAEEWASREKDEASALQRQYDSTYEQAESQFKGSRTLLANIQAARAKKLELQSRVDELQRDLAQVSKLTPSQLRSENVQIAELNEEIAHLESRLQQQDIRGTVLRAAIAKLEIYSRSMEGKAQKADADLLSLDRELTILKSSFKDEDSDHVYELRRLLAVATDTYNSLLDQAEAAGVSLPAEAQPRTALPELRMEWDDEAAAFANNWHNFGNDGFKIVGATEEYSKKYAKIEAERASEFAILKQEASAAAAAEAEANAETSDGGGSPLHPEARAAEDGLDAEPASTHYGAEVERKNSTTATVNDLNNLEQPVVTDDQSPSAPLSSKTYSKPYFEPTFEDNNPITKTWGAHNDSPDTSFR